MNFFFFQPNLAVYGNLANVRKGGESEAPPPIPAYTVDKPQPRFALFDVHSVFLFIRYPVSRSSLFFRTYVRFVTRIRKMVSLGSVKK